MLGIKDIRKSRFYQEAKQDGVEETEATHLREKLQGVRALAALGLSAEQIAKGLVFDIQQVKQELAKLSRPNDESAE